jgi:hypothetical protein
MHELEIPLDNLFKHTHIAKEVVDAIKKIPINYEVAVELNYQIWHRNLKIHSSNDIPKFEFKAKKGEDRIILISSLFLFENTFHESVISP